MRPGTRTATRFALYSLICIIVASSTFMIGYAARAAHAPITDQDTAFSVFWETWGLIDQHFYGGPPEPEVRTRGAISGSLATLADPYTVYVEPQQRDREQEDLRGSFGGIGALVTQTQDGRILLSPIEDRPAARAGILDGDELVAVDDQPVSPEMSLDDVLAAVRGSVGEVVRLTIRREGQPETLTFAVKREQIVTPSVSWELETDAIGYIRVSIFSERTSKELEDAIRELQDLGAEAFIIDLRDNGGGLLGVAVDVASQFLMDGVVMYERKNDGEEKPYPVKDKGLLLEEPMILLVNGGTASASEIVAGAIQDYGRGKLIGTKTFGKASVQLLFDLSDGSSLHVTNAHWLTPNRHEINGLGLTPDIEVGMTDTDRLNNVDPQRVQAVAYLKEAIR